MKCKEFILLWGLPGSGKSFWARKQNDYRTRILDLDQLLNKTVPGGYILREVSELVRKRVNSYERIILDGLITTNNIAESILAQLPCGPKITIVVWNEDRNACLWNDAGRREESSQFSIATLPYEHPSTELIAPNITHLQYRKIARECTRKVEFEDNDYYSRTTKVKWVCDLVRLGELLKELSCTQGM